MHLHAGTRHTSIFLSQTSSSSAVLGLLGRVPVKKKVSSYFEFLAVLVGLGIWSESVGYEINIANL